MAIPRGLKPRRSASPQDLRSAGPSGDVQRYWQPDAFVWHGVGSTHGRVDEPYIRITRNQIRISAAASEKAELKPGDLVEIGINNTFLAVRPGSAGIKVRPESRVIRKAFYVSAKKLIDGLISEGWPIPCRMICQWDERNRMLVAEKPRGGAL